MDMFTHQHFQKTANFKRYWLFLEVTLFIVTDAKLSQRQFYNELTDRLPERNCSPSFLVTGRKVIGKQLSQGVALARDVPHLSTGILRAVRESFPKLYT